jgi:kynurenine formamidase
VIDLTQTLVEGIPDWDGCCDFKMRQVMDYSEGARVHTLEMRNGIGTHIDAPSHFIEGGLDVASISLEELICPGVVINVVEKAHENFALSPDDIISFEEQHGKIPEKSVVIVYTGWGSRWHSPDQFRNVDENGVMHYPKLSVEAAELLLKRNINGIAVDTLSPDAGDLTFPVHHKLLGANKFILENVNVSDALPATGFTMVALPLKIKYATEAPCRVVALF